jgi:glutathione S-transferase
LSIAPTAPRCSGGSAIAVVRVWVAYAADPPPDPEIEARRAAGRATLEAMERHLGEHEFFVGECFSIADIALYAYTHVAPREASISSPTPPCVPGSTG